MFDCLFELRDRESDEPELATGLFVVMFDWLALVPVGDEPLLTPSTVQRTTMPTTSVTTAIMLTITTPLRPRRWISRSVFDDVTYVSSRTGSTRGLASPLPLGVWDIIIHASVSGTVVRVAMIRVASELRSERDAAGAAEDNRGVELIRALKTSPTLVFRLTDGGAAE